MTYDSMKGIKHTPLTPEQLAGLIACGASNPRGGGGMPSIPSPAAEPSIELLIAYNVTKEKKR